MILKVIVYTLLSILSISVFAQQRIDSTYIYSSATIPVDTLGEISIFQDAKIKSLLHKKVVINEARPSQKGFRIQLLSATGSNSRDKINLEKANILMNDYDVKIYIVYIAPYFKLRLGDFRTKLDAVNYMEFISEDYPQAFVVKDNVNIPSIKVSEENNEEKTDN